MLQLTNNRFVAVLLLCALGAAIGTFSGLALYATKPLYLALIIVAIVAFLPTLVLNNFRTYWLCIYLFILQFDISKNLNDGVAMVELLQIDYTLENFTFAIYAADLVFGMLMLFWLNDIMFRGKRLRIPPVTWLALGYLAFCLLSFLKAPSTYLSAVELFKQLKFFLLYLYAVNNIDSLRALKILTLMAVVILTCQSSVTILRYQTGYLEPLSFGQSYLDEDRAKEYLSVDREDQGSSVRGFGTGQSPGVTVMLGMMVIPFALILCLPNPFFGMRQLFIAIALFGMSGLLLTFTRAYYLTTAVQVVTAFILFRKSSYLTRIESLSLIVIFIVALGVVSPKLYRQFMVVRTDSVTVRLQQYTAAGKMILANPVLGVGLNNGTSLKENYVTESYNKDDSDTQYHLEPTHNIYLSLASEIGVPGVTCFVLFFVTVVRKTYKVSQESRLPETKLFANGLLIMYAGIAFGGLFDPVHHYPVLLLLWLYSGVALNLEGTVAHGVGKSVA
ncbi:MAG: putative inorganic carbon (HCO3(-)) transporter [Gammaproteobacteria bacterium]|jgi:putative inorganic carbon (HCO3(-)) transporter